MDDPIKTMEDLMQRIQRVTSRPRILVVEDDASYTKLIEHWFKELPFDLEFCFTGEDAISKLSSGKTYNLIWLDLKLPGVSGVEVLRCIKNTEVIVVTGYPDSDLAKDAFSIGVGLILRKPDSLQEFKRFLKTFSTLHG